MNESTNTCPKCGSREVTYRKSRQDYVCDKCDHIFTVARQPTSKTIFLSYGHDEFALLARRLRDDLEAAGHIVWFDEKNLHQGGDWENKIEEGIKNASVIIATLTPHAVRRPDGYCLNELSYAVSLHKRILPIMVADVTPPLSIHRIQWLDMKDALASEERYHVDVKKILDVIESEDLGFEGGHARLLADLAPLEFGAEIDQKIRGFYGRHWVLEEIESWLKDPDSPRVFFLIGGPGVGKSAIAAKIYHQNPFAAACHFCSALDSVRIDAKRAVISIAVQLASQFSEYRDNLLKSPLQEVRDKNAHAIFNEILVQPLHKISAPPNSVMIVIDALDEAFHGVDNELADLLAELFDKTPQWLRLFITSRPVPSILTALAQYQPRILDASDPRNLEDIRGFLKAGLDTVPEAIGQKLDPIIDEILHRSEGVFLYASYVLKELREKRLSLSHPEEFPQGLRAIYRQFFRRQFPDAEIYKQKFRPLLEIISAAREPIPLEIVNRMLDWKHYEGKEALEQLGALVLTDEKRLKPFHKSVIDWLTDEANTEARFFIDPVSGNKTIARYGLDVFHANGNDLDSYTLRNLPHHLITLECWGDVTDILCNLSYITQKIAAGMLDDLLKDYQDLPGNAAVMGEISTFQRFIQGNAHIFRQNPQLIFQQAINEPNNTAPRQAANNLLEAGRSPKIWCERVNKQSNTSMSILSFEKHEDKVTACAFSPDGKTIASTSIDHCLKIWDAATGACLRTLDGKSGWALSCAFSPNGAWISVGYMLGKMKLWDVITGVCVRTFEKHAGSILACAFSPNGLILASASEDKTLKLWDVNSGACIQTLEGHSQKVNWCAWDPSCAQIASASKDGTVKIWDVATGKCIHTIEAHTSDVTACNYSPDGKWFVSTSLGGAIRCWEPHTWKPIRSINPRAGQIVGCNFSPDGSILASAHFRKIILWDTKTGERLHTYKNNAPVATIAFSPNGTRIASGSWDKTLKLWDVIKKSESEAVEGHDAPIIRCFLSSDSTQLISASADRSIKIWSTDTGKCLVKIIQAHAGPVTSCAIAPDSTRIISGSWDRELKMWDVRTGAILVMSGTRRDGCFREYSGRVNACTFSPDGTTIVTGSLGGALRLWDAATANQMRSIEGHSDVVTDCIFTPDGKRIVSTSFDHTAKFWDVQNGNCLLSCRGHSDAVMGCAISPDGKLLLTASDDRTIKLWNANTGECLRTFTGHTYRVNACVFSPDASRFASASHDHTIRVWDVNSGEVLGEFYGGGAINCLAMTSSGRIFAGDALGQLFFLQWHPQSLF